MQEIWCHVLLRSSVRRKGNELWDTSSHGTIDYGPPKILWYPLWMWAVLVISGPSPRLRMSGSNCTRPSFFFFLTVFFFRVGDQPSWETVINPLGIEKNPIKGFSWHGDDSNHYLFDMAWIWSFQHGAWPACFFQVRANLQVECERRLQEAKCGRAMEDPDFNLGRGPFLENLRAVEYFASHEITEMRLALTSYSQLTIEV